MYQALYRKYRPRSFSDVAGQEHITGTLRKQVNLGRLSHAYLFVGTRGTGKTTCARILSRAVNCLNPVNGEPCNECASCVGIENGSILDVLEIDAASNNGVDNVRTLREEAVYTPASVRMRVYIIDEVHMLSNSAFNALLKILEDPPEHLLFILATTELHKVPATILSRCQRFSFKRITPAAINERLNTIAVNEGVALSADATEKIAALADGSMRDAVSLLDQCASDDVVDLDRVQDILGLAAAQKTLRLAEAAAGRNTVEALDILDGLYRDGKDMAALLSELASVAREVLIFKLSPDSGLLSGAFDAYGLSGLSALLAPERLFSMLDMIRETMSVIQRGGNAKLSVEMCLIRLCDERLSEDLPAILSRVAKLETLDVPNPPVVDDVPSVPETLNIPNPSVGDGVLDVPSVQNPPVVDDAPIVPETLNIPESSVGDGVLDVPNPSVANDVPIIPETLDVPESSVGDGVLDVPSVPNPPEGGFWQDILDILKDDPAVYAVIGNKKRIRAEYRDGALNLQTGEQQVVDQMESRMFSEPLKDAAEKVLGQGVRINIELSPWEENDDVQNDESAAPEALPLEPPPPDEAEAGKKLIEDSKTDVMASNEEKTDKLDNLMSYGISKFVDE